MVTKPSLLQPEREKEMSNGREMAAKYQLSGLFLLLVIFKIAEMLQDIREVVICACIALQ